MVRFGFSSLSSGFLVSSFCPLLPLFLCVSEVLGLVFLLQIHRAVLKKIIVNRGPRVPARAGIARDGLEVPSASILPCHKAGFPGNLRMGKYRGTCKDDN